MVDFNALWAKKGETQGQYYWLPLKTHLMDTMMVADWLWNHWLCEGQRRYLIGQMKPSNEDNAQQVIRFLGAIHDIGKATPAFQIQKGYANSEDLDRILKEKLERAGYEGISNLSLSSPRSTHHTLAGEVILNEFGIRDDIASIIGGHHGKPLDKKPNIEAQLDAYACNYYQTEDNNSAVCKRWLSTHESILQWALKESRVGQKDNLPIITQPGQVLLSGLLIMADWIASNELYFPLFNANKDTQTSSTKRFEKGISAWYKTLPIEYSSGQSADKLYNKRFGFLPRNFQKVVYETVERISESGIIIIEAPMGCGKTESALTAAEQVSAKTGRSGLFFGLPTQATANSMFDRVLEWLCSVTDEQNEEASLRLSHGNSAFNETMRSLANHIDEEDSEGNVIVNQWFAGRKTSMLDDYVVGTVDHFLLNALKQKHLALRHLGFSRKTVVIDEVHAYDVYMQQYLEEALMWMGAYGVPVILLSATLPADKRADLTKSYLRGRGLKARDIEGLKEVRSAIEYPLITYSEGDRVCMQKNFPVSSDKDVMVKPLDKNNLTDVLYRMMDQGGIVGIIVNTVASAQKLAEECIEKFGLDMVILLHSSFIITDRIRKENELTSMIGKGAERPYRKIIIGTQVMEQSLDIDFDVLITDLCPMDLLLQRIGRLHRHAINRPSAHQTPVCYVMGLSKDLDFDPGSVSVYGQYYLTRTQYYLREIIQLPGDISSLVQAVYSEVEPELPEELRIKYIQGKKEYCDVREREMHKAHAFRIGNPKTILAPEKKGCNLIGWLSDAQNIECEEQAFAQVRDIQETAEVIAIKRRGSGYRMFGGNRDISGDIGEVDTQRLLAQQSIRLPLSAVRKSGIKDVISWLEKYNKTHLPQWQKQQWLKGALGIVFDENQEFIMGNTVLTYDEIYGLRVKEEGWNE